MLEYFFFILLTNFLTVLLFFFCISVSIVAYGVSHGKKFRLSNLTVSLPGEAND
jgi:hypothetical protein